MNNLERAQKDIDSWPKWKRNLVKDIVPVPPGTLRLCNHCALQVVKAKINSVDSYLCTLCEKYSPIEEVVS